MSTIATIELLYSNLTSPIQVSSNYGLPHITLATPETMSKPASRSKPCRRIAHSIFRRTKYELRRGSIHARNGNTFQIFHNLSAISPVAAFIFFLRNMLWAIRPPPPSSGKRPFYTSPGDSSVIQPIFPLLKSSITSAAALL
mgnify:CR=1 FL=1